MGILNYSLIVLTSGNDSHDNYANEAAHVKNALEEALVDLKFSSGMAQIEVSSLTEV